MYTVVLIVHLLVSFILIAVILLQAGRGGGLAEMFGGSGTQSILGTRASTFLTRATTGCAILFLLTSLTLAVLSAQQGRSLMMQHKPKPTPTTPTTPPSATSTPETPSTAAPPQPEVPATTTP